MKFFNIFAVATALSVLFACTDPSFKIKGEIEGADSGSVILEKADHAGIWIALDSAKISSGKFSISAPAPAAPEIYRLNYNGQYVYIPIDSIETVSMTSSAKAFDTDFSLAGTTSAEALAAFEKELIAFTPYFNNPDSLNIFKRRIFSNYLQDSRGSVVSYYALTKTVGGMPLFDMTKDSKYFSAVATSFRQFRPNDPRTRILENTAREAQCLRNEASGRRKVIAANELNLIDISLRNDKGETIRLSETTGGIPTVLMFAELTDPATPALNVELRKAFEAGRCKIYQVGMDADQIAWRDAASNLPWTTVYGGNVNDLRNLIQSYQITTLPAYFIINTSGVLSGRPADLQATLRSL